MTTKKEAIDPLKQQRDYYKSLGLAWCEKCQSPRITDLQGKQLCQIAADTCPLKKE